MVIPIKNTIKDILSENFRGFPNINYKLLKKICQLSPDKIAAMYGIPKYTVKDSKGQSHHYYYKNNNSKILAVAHLDTVLPPTHFDTARLTGDTIIYSPTLDDRLGVYIILDLLPLKNIDFDILLTLDEERGQSTASYFIPPRDKHYNWMFSFDKEGLDYVLYQYHNDELVNLLSQFSFTAPQKTYRSRYTGYYSGSYSDLVELDDLGCVGINFGAGYYDKHQLRSYASKMAIMNQIVKFKFFYDAMYREHLLHERHPEISPVTNIPASNKLIKNSPSQQINKEAEIERAMVLYEYGNVDPEVLETTRRKMLVGESNTVKRTKAHILLSSPDILLLSDEAMDFLNEREMYMVIEFAMLKYSDLVLLAAGKEQLVREIGNRLLNVGLHFNINPNDYGIKVIPTYDKYGRFSYNTFVYDGPIWTELNNNVSQKAMKEEYSFFFTTHQLKETVNLSKEFEKSETNTNSAIQNNQYELDFTTFQMPIFYRKYRLNTTKDLKLRVSNQINLDLKGYEIVKTISGISWELSKSSSFSSTKLKPGFVVI